MAFYDANEPAPSLRFFGLVASLYGSIWLYSLTRMLNTFRERRTPSSNVQPKMADAGLFTLRSGQVKGTLLHRLFPTFFPAGRTDRVHSDDCPPPNSEYSRDCCLATYSCP